MKIIIFLILTFHALDPSGGFPLGNRSILSL